MLGVVLALLSAATFGLTSAALRRGVLGGTVIQGLSVTIPLGIPLFALACLAAGGFSALAEFSLSSWAWLAAAGVIHFGVGRYGNFRATKALGATQIIPIQQMSVLVALVLALIFLSETLTPLRGLGIALVLLGPLIALPSRKGARLTTRAGQSLDHVEGYVWSAVCAVAWGVSPLLITFGLAGGGVVTSLAGGFVSYLAATILIVSIVVMSGSIGHVRRLDPGTALWFVASGTLVFLSQMFRYMALAVAPVSVVAPVQQTMVVFKLVANWLINRDHEVFTAASLAGISLSTLGVAMLTLSVDNLVEIVPVPGWLAEIVAARWP